jgi:hypothetical protein
MSAELEEELKKIRGTYEALFGAAMDTTRDYMNNMFMAYIDKLEAAILKAANLPSLMPIDLSLVHPPPVHPPPKDKEEEEGDEKEVIGEDLQDIIPSLEEDEEEERGPAMEEVILEKRSKPESSSESGLESDSEDHSVVILSDSSSSSDQEEEDEPKRLFRKRHDEDKGEEEEEGDDDFVASDKKKPKVYSPKVMQEYIIQGIERDIGKGKRKRTQRKIWSPSDHDKEREGRVDNVLDEPSATVSKQDLAEFRRLLTDIRADGFEAAIAGNLWYERHFGHPLEGIRNNLGLDGFNQRARDMFALIVNRCTAPIDEEGHWVAPVVESRRTGGPGARHCCLCDKAKNCAHTLWITDREQDRESAHHIAICCSLLARSLVAFFTELIRLADSNARGTDAEFKAVENLFAAVQDAHANKGDKQRWKKAHKSL